MKQREKLSSRLGFILLSAGCAIGIGNVYRFPIITGSYGGAIFVLIYVGFLILLGLPAMTAEFSVGRAAQRSIATSFEALEKPRQKWHLMKYFGIAGNYLLMMCYTTISGWMLLYFFQYLSGSITKVPAEDLPGVFQSVCCDNVWSVLLGTVVIIVACFLICSLGLQKGVERITKVMMIALFVLMLGLVIYSLLLPGAGEGLKFYLIPSFENIQQAGIWKVISAAMGQAFFTLSIGIGSIAIFGSYIGKERRLLGEAVTVVSLDTAVAMMAGLIIFPACFTYIGGVPADAEAQGPLFLFTTLSSIFNAMPMGQLIGALFFLLMTFAAVSTVIAVFENIISFWLELTPLKRSTVAMINIGLMILLSLPCVLGLNLWSGVQLFGMSIMDLEDFTVSKLMLPLGTLIYVVFCTSRYGWGWKNYYNEVNTGTKGLSVPRWIRPYMTFVLPVIILLVLSMTFLPI